MCSTCGCGAGETRVGGKPLSEPEDDPPQRNGHAPPQQAAEQGRPGRSTIGYRAVVAADGQHRHGAGPWHRHHHPAAHPDDAATDVGEARADAPAPTTTQSRMVRIERDILARNDGYAAQNRQRFDEQGILALNLVSSPGSGKTSLLCRSIEAPKDKL